MAIKKKSRPSRKTGQGIRGWILSHFSAILVSGSLLFVLVVSLVAVGYVIFLRR